MQSEPIPFNADAIPSTHTISYRVRDSHKGCPSRPVEVLATPEEIQAFVRDGYLVRRNLIDAPTIQKLRDALAEVIEHDGHIERGGGKAFGGIFLRHLMDKHPAFLGFLNFAPTLSVARAVFGPQVQHRGFTARVCYPDAPEQQTEWHFHQRLVPDPLPPLFSRPVTMDVLLYLDEVTEQNGPLQVIPGSHNFLETDLAADDFEPKENAVTLQLPAGSAVLTHGSLWHRALPTQPGCGMRRLLLFGYGPTWQKVSVYGVKPENGLTAQILTAPDCTEETRELLGVGGYM